MEGIFDAKKLAAYISRKYSEKFGKKISPVRMQKTLYFAFAYWGGFFEKSKFQNEMEINISQYQENLFWNRIEAWVYGPVIPDVYFSEDIDSFFDENMFNDYEPVKEIIDNVIQDTFQVNDFKLVDISHCDNAWKNKFDYEETYHNNEIDKREIIEEYARK